ncbi:MAG: hypothetical protein HYZ93_01425 [Candidatus Omnitrophica bacterium]|nr:hypothetical protein [Candidatus Omnitrophota bacterium]
MSFRLNTPYYPIPGSRPEGTFGAIMEILLKTRLKLHLETRRELYDEDVNAYLAGLLVSYIDPEYLQAVSEVLSRSDLDLYHAVDKAQDKVQVYWIYKANADDLLVSLGVFRRIWQEYAAELDRMRRYYTYASEYQRRIYGKPTAVGEIQVKLAEGQKRYLTILATARSEYLHFLEQIQNEEMRAFSHRLARMEGELPLKAKWDEFLDAYAAWLKGSRDPVLRQKILQLVKELEGLDQTFKNNSVISILDHD